MSAGDISEDLNLQPFYLSTHTHCKPKETVMLVALSTHAMDLKNFGKRV